MVVRARSARRGCGGGRGAVVTGIVVFTTHQCIEMLSCWNWCENKPCLLPFPARTFWLRETSPSVAQSTSSFWFRIFSIQFSLQSDPEPNFFNFSPLRARCCGNLIRTLNRCKAPPRCSWSFIHFVRLNDRTLIKKWLLLTKIVNSGSLWIKEL